MKNKEEPSITLLFDSDTIDNELAVKIMVALSDACKAVTGSRLVIAVKDNRSDRYYGSE